MSEFEVSLPQTDVMELQKMALHPGWPVIAKLLRAVDAGAIRAAVSCTIPNRAIKLTLFEEAQAVHRVIERLIALLDSYSTTALPTQEVEPEQPKLFENVWGEGKAN